jgi:hypothetical protein
MKYCTGSYQIRSIKFIHKAIHNNHQARHNSTAKKQTPIKKPPKGGLCKRVELLQLHFFVVNMLASFWIKLADQHLLGHGFFVFGCGVEMTGTSSGFQLDFFASAFCHDLVSLSLATCAHVSEHSIDAVFVDQTQSSVGYAQTYPAVFGFDEKAAVLQVRHKPALGFVVGVGNIVSYHGLLARYVADACHISTPSHIKLTALAAPRSTYCSVTAMPQAVFLLYRTSIPFLG